MLNPFSTYEILLLHDYMVIFPFKEVFKRLKVFGFVLKNVPIPWVEKQKPCVIIKTVQG